MRYMKLINIIPLLYFLTECLPIFAQNTNPPLSFGNSSILNPNQIQTINLPTFNNSYLMYQDSLASINDSIKSSNFGKAILINCGLNNSGTWETLPDSSKLWRLRIVSVNAYLIF